MQLTENSAAPGFTLPDQDGNEHSLSDYKGKWLVLYFYPKDDTPGCTKEACNFRDEHTALEKLGAVIIGVSADPVAKHKKFADKYDLPFTLLSDESKEMLQAYGVWQEKSMYGKKYMGIARTTFIVNPDGNIVKIYEKVKPVDHGEKVAKDLQSLQ